MSQMSAASLRVGSDYVLREFNLYTLAKFPCSNTVSRAILFPAWFPTSFFQMSEVWKVTFTCLVSIY